ncbi:glycosyltransferase [Planctomycetota bacterium]|nr:glycosyltransferase [Planctomycetota bacterium]
MPKIGLANDWITTYGGSEKVLEAFSRIYPDAPLHTSLYNAKAIEHTGLANLDIRTSFLQKIPFAIRKYKAFLPFMPFAIEQLDFDDYDIILSSSHAIAKGIITNANQLHICYMHTPIRYAWDLQQTYLKEAKLGYSPRGLAARLILHYIRNWDQLSANRPDHYIANSNYVARRIYKVYRREADVVYPPVDVDRFVPSKDRGDFYLVVTRLVPYKKVELIAKACIKAKRKLVIIGNGPEMKKLKMINHPDIQLLGHQSDEVVNEHMQTCKAFIFAADEDFGIVPVEAQAAGAPVIAYGRGGCLETVVEGKTGCFFSEQNESTICDAIERFERIEHTFDMHEIVAHAQQFSAKRFKEEIERFVEKYWHQFKGTKVCSRT